MCIVCADSSWSIAFVNCTEFSVLKVWQLKYSVAGSRHMHYSIHPIITILNKKRKILYWKQSIEWKTHGKKIRKSTCTMIRIKTGFDSWTNKRQVEINLRKPSGWWLQYNSVDNDQILPLIAYFSWTGFAGLRWFIFDSSTGQQHHKLLRPYILLSNSNLKLFVRTFNLGEGLGTVKLRSEV